MDHQGDSTNERFGKKADQLKTAPLHTATPLSASLIMLVKNSREFV